MKTNGKMKQAEQEMTTGFWDEEDFKNPVGEANLPDLTVGSYKLKLKKLVAGKTLSGAASLKAIVEVVDAKGELASPVGAVRSIYFQRHYKYPSYFARETRSLLGAIAGKNPNEITMNEADFLISEEAAGEIAGVTFAADFVAKEGKFMKDGSPAAIRSFSFVAGQ